MPSLDDLLKEMEKMWEPQEEEFEITRVLYSLQETCPVHQVGAKDLKLQRYVCPICNIALAKTPR